MEHWADDAREVPRLTSDGRHHAVRYMESFVFGQELAAFWGDYGAYKLPEDQQHRLLPISRPDDWAAASQEFRDVDYFKSTWA